jgi:hypothetical protein
VGCSFICKHFYVEGSCGAEWYFKTNDDSNSVRELSSLYQRVWSCQLLEHFNSRSQDLYIIRKHRLTVNITAYIPPLMTNYRGGRLSGNALDLYSGGDGFESRPGYRHCGLT